MFAGLLGLLSHLCLGVSCKWHTVLISETAVSPVQASSNMLYGHTGNVGVLDITLDN